jgi:putative endonuclease
MGAGAVEHKRVRGTAMIDNQPAIYILASRRNGTLYIGVTSDLVGRVSVHKQDLIGGFTSRYGVHQLVHVEMHATMDAAINREKELKKWSRARKMALIERSNPTWRDLCPEVSGLLDPSKLPKLI